MVRFLFLCFVFSFLGVDIVPALIADNRVRYRDRTDMQFDLKDIVVDVLPAVRCFLCVAVAAAAAVVAAAGAAAVSTLFLTCSFVF